jgi:predicted Rossmann fold nucleotide-binding protein DprA/Smf involved in DNA uptake
VIAVATDDMLDLLDMVVASAEPDSEPIRLNPVQRKLLTLCQRPVTVADLASDMELPVDVVRALLADLITRGKITVAARRPDAAQPPANDVLKEILKELRES